MYSISRSSVKYSSSWVLLNAAHPNPKLFKHLQGTKRAAQPSVPRVRVRNFRLFIWIYPHFPLTYARDRGGEALLRSQIWLTQRQLSPCSLS